MSSLAAATEKKKLFYEKPIGTKGVKWGPVEKEQWFKQQTVKRSYTEEVLAKVETLKAAAIHDIIQYGTLSSTGHPLYCVRTKNWDNAKKTVLVTGGVHGYETSGVQGALRFVETKMSGYEAHANFIVFLCICPWGYETINRWNTNAIDPNRSFAVPNTDENENRIEETSLVMEFLQTVCADSSRTVDFIMHMDLHETTNTDVTTFGPALAARDGIAVEETTIPDGFYLVGDSDRPQAEFEKAILDSVATVTHLVPDTDTLLGEPCAQRAVVRAPARQLQLCMGLLPSEPTLYTVTTEVYPDSPQGVTAEECTLAQVAAITGGLDYIIANVLLA